MKYELDLIDARNEGMEKDQPTSKQKISNSLLSYYTI
ncbi:Uncharacterised protein [Limosilactobacillus oris]|nr:Uncharacterised protein [Limosilactobacillus oris]